MSPEARERLVHLLSTAELGLKEAVVSLRDAEELLKKEPNAVAGLNPDQLGTYASVMETNRFGIVRLEEWVSQHLLGESP
jgi:hypothetical protein